MEEVDYFCRTMLKILYSRKPETYSVKKAPYAIIKESWAVPFPIKRKEITLRKLSKLGFVEMLGPSKWKITPLGEKFFEAMTLLID